MEQINYQQKVLELTEQISVMKRKSRSDKGKERKKYDKSLPDKYRSYLMRANKKGLKFSLTIEQFYQILNSECVYCTNQANSIDRKDSKQGYILDNVQPCCYTCNRMKWDMSEYKFLKHVESIHQKRNTF